MSRHCLALLLFNQTSIVGARSADGTAANQRRAGGAGVRSSPAPRQRARQQGDFYYLTGIQRPTRCWYCYQAALKGKV